MSGEVLSNAQMAAADNFAVQAGTPTATLMENAGRAVADAIASRFAPSRVAVLAGKGNNGGDALVTARYLASRDFTVRIASFNSLAPSILTDVDLVVDGLFGTGLSRPLDGAARAVVAALNEKKLPTIAIDIPSGISGDTGRPLGDTYVHANLTVTFFRKKPAHLLLPGRDLCGEIVLADIGIPDGALDLIHPNLFENSPSLWGAEYPWPRNDAHKYARGHCVVVSGPAHATGAARLAARGALRIGAGLVSVASPAESVPVNAAHLTAIMIKPFEDLGGLLADKRFNAVVMGPGLGVNAHTRKLVLEAAASTARLVLDADALSVFADNPKALFKALRPGAAVLTPHEGEFERLFPGLLQESAGKLEAVRAAAARAGAVMALKGSDTVIARPDGWAVINANAPATLATAGSGDVLAGLIGGLLAQGLEAGNAAAAAVWLHGDAAARFGPGLIAEDIPEILPESLTALQDRLRPI